MRGNTELKEIFRAKALTQSSVNRFSAEIPTGEGWYSLLLRYNLVLTVGTGVTPRSQALLRILKGITLRSDKGEYFINNVPGRVAYYFDAIKAGTPALLDTFAAASATYRCLLKFWFADPLQAFPEDTIIDTGRYQSMTLEVALGSLSDCLGTVGTATATHALDAYIERQKGPVPQKVKPRFYPEFGVRVPADPTSVSEILLERASNLAYERLLVLTGNVTTVAGEPASGDLDSAMLADLTVDHDGGRPFETIPFSVLQNQNRQDYSLEAVPAGVAVADFARDGSMQSALYSGDKSRLSLKWSNGTLGASPQVTVGYEGFRPLVA